MTRLHLLAIAVLFALITLVAGASALAQRAEPPRVDSHGVGAQPVVTLGVRVSGTRPDTGATISFRGAFRGRAVAGRGTYRLLPRGVVVATHRHGAAAPQRARVDELFLDARSDSEYLRVVGTGHIIGGPPIRGPGGACQNVTFRFVARPAANGGGLRWACRRAGADRSPPIHLDVLSLPRDTIVSSYTLIRRPCSSRPTENARAGCQD